MGTTRRIGAKNIASVPNAVLAALNKGELETVNLVEALAMDTASLLTSCYPHLAINPLEFADLGITQRIKRGGALLAQHCGDHRLGEVVAHPSDTIRGMAAYWIGHHPEWPLAEKLRQIKPLAEDGHYNVREWAWLGLRHAVADELTVAIELLTPWAQSPNENARRFASEVTRPRGVWSPHIPQLKANPALAMPLLEPLKSDDSRYVRLSVGNWLNDASKSQPDWVTDVCRDWLLQSPTAATKAICHHGLRTVRKAHPEIDSP